MQIFKSSVNQLHFHRPYCAQWTLVWEVSCCESDIIRTHDPTKHFETSTLPILECFLLGEHSRENQSTSTSFSTFQEPDLHGDLANFHLNVINISMEFFLTNRWWNEYQEYWIILLHQQSVIDVGKKDMKSLGAGRHPKPTSGGGSWTTIPPGAGRLMQWPSQWHTKTWTSCGIFNGDIIQDVHGRPLNGYGWYSHII